MMTFTGENIWVIGASSRIGKTLCEQLANYGATLLLSDRCLEALEKLNQHLGGQPYSAIKFALINCAQSLYVEVEKSIDIKVINPKFVKTPMTEKMSSICPCIWRLKIQLWVTRKFKH